MIDAVSDFGSKVQKSENFYKFRGRRGVFDGCDGDITRLAGLVCLRVFFGNSNIR